MSAAEDDTELRDLLVLNLENSGVLNKIKAEMRAAVFLAMEDQDRLQGRSPLTNQQLSNCLRSPEGGLAVGLILDFLQVFNLDFSLSVFQPEINTCVVDSRDVLCTDLCLSPPPHTQPLLLELLRRGRHARTTDPPQDLSENQIMRAHRKFKIYDKSGLVLNEDLKNVFTDLLPSVNRNMLETFINDELKTADRSSSEGVDFQLFLQMYKHLYCQCRAVVTEEDDDEERLREGSANQGGAAEPAPVPAPTFTQTLDLEHEDHGDSFFDDPLPTPQKTYGGKVDVSSRTHTGSEPGSTLSERSHTRSGDSKRRTEQPDEDAEYDDDFNSHRSDLSRSELSIGEEIEEVSIEGPAHSEQDSTQDLSVSQLSHAADYMEEVS